MSDMEDEERPTKNALFFEKRSSVYQSPWDAMHALVGADYTFTDTQNSKTLGWTARFIANDFYGVHSREEYATAYEARRHAVKYWLNVWDEQYFKKYPRPAFSYPERAKDPCERWDYCFALLCASFFFLYMSDFSKASTNANRRMNVHPMSEVDKTFEDEPLKLVSFILGAICLLCAVVSTCTILDIRF
jgi:hypothetical protein